MTMEDIAKGYVTLMWNKLFDDAYKSGCDYFYQCGDDMEFKTKGWINDSIKVLKSKNDIGLAGPVNNNNRMYTEIAQLLRYQGTKILKLNDFGVSFQTPS